jgi:hypothetical protein
LRRAALAGEASIEDAAAVAARVEAAHGIAAADTRLDVVV